MFTSLVLGLRMMRALTPRSPKETQGERALFRPTIGGAITFPCAASERHFCCEIVGVKVGDCSRGLLLRTLWLS